MKITVEKTDDINIIIRGTIENSVIHEKITELKDQAVKALKKDKTIDAQTTEDKLNKMRDSQFQREAEGQILQDFIEAGMKKANLDQDEILGQPNFKKYEQEKTGVSLEVEISTSPVIDTNVEYMDIVPNFTIPTVDPKNVDAKLAEMALKKAPYTKIKTERSVKNGDLVVLDFEGFLNGRALQGANETEYKLKIGSNSMIPGFEEAVIGMRSDEEKTIKVTFPKEFQTKELAGQETEFNVKLLEIQEQIPLELNDALAQRIFDDERATLDLLKLKMTEKITSQAFSNLYNEELKPQIIRGLLSKFDFTLPNNVIEQEIDAKINERAQRMSKEEHALYKEDREKFNMLRDMVRQEAKDSIKAALIVDALAKKEGIEVDDEEVLSALSYEAMMRGKDAEELIEYYKTNNLMTSAKVGLKEDKLFRKMLGVPNQF